MIDESDKFCFSLRVSHSLGRLERVSVFTLLFHSPSARFQEANWKDAGENVQVFPEPGQEPSRASLDVRTRGLPKAYGPASQIRLHSEPLTRDSILTTPDWLRMWGAGGWEEMISSRRRGVWWKERKPPVFVWPWPNPSFITYWKWTVFSSVKLGQQEVPHRVALQHSAPMCYFSSPLHSPIAHFWAHRLSLGTRTVLDIQHP